MMFNLLTCFGGGTWHLVSLVAMNKENKEGYLYLYLYLYITLFCQTSL